jgi:hypothetical protein
VRFASALTLDNGASFEVRPFQRWLLGPYFAGARESVLSTSKGQGKSTILGGLGLFSLLREPESDIIVAAASRDQASVLLGQAAGFVRRSAALARRLRMTRREILYPARAGRLRVISADANTGDGLIPTLVLADELHRWRSADLFETLQTALAKRAGRMLTISTSGIRGESPLWPIREKALSMGACRDGVRLSVDSPDGSFALRELSAPDDVDWRNLDVACAVNPLASREVLAQRLDSPSQNERSWRRFTLNQWLEPSAQDATIDPEMWAALTDADFTSIMPVCFAVDVTPDRGAAAIVAATYNGAGEDRRLLVDVVECGDGVGWVLERLRELDARHDHVGVVLDGAGPAGALAARLEEFDIPLHVTSARDYARACQGFYDLVREGRLAHRDQPPLSVAVQAATRRRLTDGWAWSRSRSLGSIAPLCAASLAAWGLQTHGPISREAFDALR